MDWTYEVKLPSGEVQTRVRETGSLTAARLDITEEEASVHVWTSQVPEDVDDRTPDQKRWDRQTLCGGCFQIKSSGGKCHCDE